MLKLGDFFAPLNLYTLIYFLGLVLFFDVLGTFVKKKIVRKNASSRIINWLIGFGFFIFVWFILRFFIPPHRSYLLISIAGLFLISLPTYLKQGDYLALFKDLWDKKIVLLIIAPFLPALFVKASLPPYYADEMAYHFLSPSGLAAIEPWNFHGGLYVNLPRVMNLFYDIAFSLVRTYSVARLINFSILATAMLYSYSVLKRNFGFLTGFLFVFIFFSLHQSIVFTSTLGYVDVPTYSFLLMGLMSSLDYLVDKRKSVLVIAAIFWSLALGTKYTPLTALVAFSVVFFATTLLEKKHFKKLVKPRFLLTLLAVFLLFGGYWYVKNFLVYGNPIYPFLFPCKAQYAADCVRGSGFFGDWTLPVTFGNLYQILKELLPKNKLLHLGLATVPVLQLVNTNKKTRILTIVLLGAVAVELFILSRFSGFLIRYQQHMQFFLIAAFVIQLANRYENKELYPIQKVIFLAVGVSTFFSYIYVVRHTNSLKTLNWQEINYSIGKIDIYDWVELKFPKMKDTILWCESPPGDEPAPLARFDPDLIWYAPAGKMRSFMTNCYYHNPPVYSEDPKEVVDVAVEKKLTFWISTNSKCLPRGEVKRARETEDDEKFRLRRLSNELVCNSEEILPYLYYFDYKNVVSEKN